MPRRHPPRPAPPAPGDTTVGWVRQLSEEDGDWLVRAVPGARSTKTYRCPGCDHEIGPGTGHVVAWPAGESGAVMDRRHWHTACWAARHHRHPTTRRW